MRHGNNMPTAISGRGRDCDSEHENSTPALSVAISSLTLIS